MTAHVSKYLFSFVRPRRTFGGMVALAGLPAQLLLQWYSPGLAILYLSHLVKSTWLLLSISPHSAHRFVWNLQTLPLWPILVHTVHLSSQRSKVMNDS